MMYHACSRPGRKPRQQSARLMSESAPQMPFFTQTVCVVSDGVARDGHLVRGCGVGTYLQWGGRGR